MTTYHGNDGVVSAGGNSIAEITDFTIDTTAQTTNDNSMGDEWDTHIVHRKGWSGTINVRYDPSDTNGQATLIEGATVALVAYPTGNPSGRQSLTGNATITGVSISSDQDNTVTGSYSIQGNGALTRATVV